MSGKRSRSKPDAPQPSESLEDTVQRTVTSVLRTIAPSKRYEFRRKAKLLLCEAVCKTVPKDYAALAEQWKNAAGPARAAEIEEHVYWDHFAFDERTYSERIRCLGRHLPSAADELLRLDPGYVAGMSASELTMTAEIPFVVEQKEQKDIYGAKSEIRCRKCNSSTSYESIQLRGADEPATVFYKCDNRKCNRLWRGC
jgi:DNA-directed RNA polymerase subunit M/transcription elongation factor TFIIS